MGIDVDKVDSVRSLAEEVMLELSYSDDQYVLEDDPFESSVNGAGAFGFTLMVKDLPYKVYILQED